MELANRTQHLQHSQGLSKLDAIKLLLAKFAVRRQAQIGEVEYGVYSADLESFDLADIQTALDKWEPRREGETAFPDAPAMVAAVKKLKAARRDGEALAKENARVADFKENPDKYLSREEVAELNKEIAEKFSFERRHIINTDPVMQACPHCQKDLPIAPNIRFWSPSELRSYADTLEGVQNAAKANRDIYQAEQERMAGQQAVLAEGIM